MRRSLSGLVVPILLIGLAVLCASCSEQKLVYPELPLAEIVGQQAIGLGVDSATLEGSVHGHGLPTSCWFRYGTDSTYGMRTPDIDAGAVDSVVTLQAGLTGLTPGAGYSFSMVAVSHEDTVFGPEATFQLTNQPPDTRVTLVPPDINVISIFWTGSDPDGSVDRFRWRLSANGFDGLDEGDTLGLPWFTTVHTDSVFVVAADQPGVAPDPAGTGRPRFGQVYTFWIKAVDNTGLEDPDPTYVTFAVATEAPEATVSVTPAVDPLDTCQQSQLPVAFGWGATDPDVPVDPVLEIRIQIVDLADLGLDACLTRAEFEALDPAVVFPEIGWGDWKEYDADDPVQSAYNLGAADVGKRFLFAAQARDGAGAYTETFVWNENVRHVEVLPD